MSISKQSFSHYKIKSGLYLNISESTYIFYNQKIKEFVSRKKYSKLSLEEECDIIYISRRTFTNYKKGYVSKVPE